MCGVSIRCSRMFSNVTEQFTIQKMHHNGCVGRVPLGNRKSEISELFSHASMYSCSHHKAAAGCRRRVGRGATRGAAVWVKPGGRPHCSTCRSGDSYPSKNVEHTHGRSCVRSMSRSGVGVVHADTTALGLGGVLVSCRWFI